MQPFCDRKFFKSQAERVPVIELKPAERASNEMKSRYIDPFLSEKLDNILTSCTWYFNEENWMVVIDHIKFWPNQFLILEIN